MDKKREIENIIREYTCDCQKINGSSDCYGCVHSDEYGHTCNLEGNIAQALLNADYGKVEDYKKEIGRLKEENEKLKCNCFKSFRDIETCETIVNGVRFSDEQIIVLSAYINNYQAIRRQAIKEFAEKLSNEFYKLNQKPYDTLHNFEIDDLVNAEIDLLLKEYGVE